MSTPLDSALVDLLRYLPIWWGAFRPYSLTAGLIPVCLGTALAARGEFHPLLFILALVGGLAIQIGTNLVNEYYDYVQGVATLESSGPSRVIQRHLLAPRTVLTGGLVAFAFGSA